MKGTTPLNVPVDEMKKKLKITGVSYPQNRKEHDKTGNSQDGI
jgi:hypothetical protein